MQITIVYVEAFFELDTTYQEPKQSSTEYYALFKSIRYMVTTHGRHQCYHLKMYDKHWNRLMVTEGIVVEQAIDTKKR